MTLEDTETVNIEHHDLEHQDVAHHEAPLLQQALTTTPLHMVVRPLQLVVDSRIEGLDIVAPSDGHPPRCLLQQECRPGARPLERLGIIVDSRYEWGLRLQWRVWGQTAEVLTGYWNVEALLLHVDGQRGPALHRSVEHLRTDNHDYDTVIIVPPGAVAGGFYKLFVTLVLDLPDGNSAPICAIASTVVRFMG